MTDESCSYVLCAAVVDQTYLDLTVYKQLLHGLSVSLVQTSVMHPNAKGQR